jgi:hypothetical protein
VPALQAALEAGRRTGVPVPAAGEPHPSL